MDGQKIKIRCPSCGKDGKARHELIGRRVACKHCSYEFRVTEVEDLESNGHPFATSPATDTPREPESRNRIEALEVEIRALRNEIASRAPDQSGRLHQAEARALEREGRLAEPRPDREGLLLREIESLRVRLEAAEEDRRDAEDARDRAIREVEVRAGAQAEELRILRIQLADAREASIRADDAREAMEKELAQIRTELESDEVEAAAPSEVDQLLDEVRTLREEQEVTRSDAESEARSLREELERVRAEARAANALRMEVEAASLAAGQLHAEEIAALRGAAEDVEALRRGFEEAIAERERLRSDLDGLRARADEADRLEAEVGALRDEFREALMQSAAETIVDPDQSGIREFVSLQEDRDRLRDEVAAIRLELEGAAARVRELEANQVAESGLGSEIARLRSELDEATARADRAADEVQAASEEASLRERRSHEAELNRLRDEFAGRTIEADRDIQALREEKVRLKAEFEAHLADAATAPEDLQPEVDRLLAQVKAQRSESERELQAVRDENARLRAEVDSRVAEVARVKGDLQAEFDRIHVEAERLRIEISDRLAAEDVSRHGLQRLLDETQALRAENAALAELLSSKTDELSFVQDEAERAGRALRFEVEAARKTAEVARAESEAMARSLREYEAELNGARAEIERLRREAAAEALTTKDAESAPSPAAQEEAEAARRKAVDEAVKNAWADFERRLAETQEKLRAANARADLLEAQAREASEQVVAFQRGLELGEFTSFEESQASMTSLGIASKRGGTPLTWANAEARLALARQLAAERKDRPLIDRIGKVVEKVQADIENRNTTLAETLVRGVEIEVGLDPGGWSIGGQKIFRPSPSILASLGALAPAFDRVMRQGDHPAILAMIREMRTILGDQAGLPEVRRPGRTPNVKRPIGEADAARLFLAALEGENWLMRPILANRPPPDTALMTYACLVEACAEARDAVCCHLPGRVEMLDRILQATAGMLLRRQQTDGHFPFLDPRGKASRFASVVEGMVTQQPGAVKDGWVVAIDPIGAAQVETGFCGTALARAGTATGRTEWTDAARRAADWALGQPNLPNFLANASSLRLMSWAYRIEPTAEYLDGMASRLSVGLFPGQVENGRWIDASSAQTTNHLAILLALHDARAALPEASDGLHHELSACIDRAMGSLLAECTALGVPASGAAIRCLIRHRDQLAAAGGTNNPRIESAILDSATVIQELCHEGPRPKLGVSPDLLAELVRI